MAAVTLVKALKSYFDIPANKMVSEFQKLTEKDKNDFVEMFADIGMEVERKVGGIDIT